MNSRDFYRILTGWDVENYLTVGIRYCAIFIKNTESLEDDLLIQYEDGTRRRVAGAFLFTNKDLALAWVSNKQAEEISAIQSQITDLMSKIDDVNYAYGQVTIEEPKNISVV